MSERPATASIAPNFFLVGGKKCGTTSLYGLLDAHPEIAFPYKEIHYFSYAGRPRPTALPDNVVTSPDEYYRLFEPLAGHPVRGDASPSYLTNEDAAGRIHDEVPDARIVAVLRHPVERMFSDYLHERRRGREPATTFAEAMAADGRPGRQNYASKSRYASHIERFRSLFDHDRLRFLVYEDYVADPTAFVSDIYAFLDVDPSFVPPLAGQRTNRSGVARSGVVDRITSSTQLRSVARRVLPARLHTRLGRGIYNANTEKPEMDPATRADQLARFDDDIRCVERLLGRDLTEWRT